MSRRITTFLLVGAACAAVVAVVVAVLTGTPWWSPGGLPDAGEFTRTGLVAVRALADIAAVVCVGSLLLAAFLVPRQRSGLVDVDGYAALRTAAVAASAWLAAAPAGFVFTASDGMGVPIGDLLLSPQRLGVAIDALELPKAWLVTAAVVVVLVFGCRISLSWTGTAGLFAVGVFALLPVAVTGHSASGGSHDVATNSLIYHLVAAALWVGGLVAVLALGFRGSRNLGTAVHRFSRQALACWLVMAASGVLNAWLRMSPADLFGTSYGLLVLVKIAALAALGVIGYRQRDHSVRALTWRADRRPLVRLAAVEILIMLVTIGIATALGRTPPPPRASALPSAVELLIGYDLAGPPTFDRLLFEWRFDLIFGAAAVALAAWYLLAVRRLTRRGHRWPAIRTVAWLSGCVVLLVATSSGLGRYAPAVFSLHMASQLLIAVVAPILLALGGPVLLALRTAPDGRRDWLPALLRSRACRLLCHPAVAFVLLTGPLYLLYFAGAFDTVVGYHWAHLAMNAYFLVAGYLLFWPVAGPDPAPRRLPPAGRVGVMFALLPAFGFLAVAVMNSSTLLGGGFYWSLNLPWAGDLLADQRASGMAVWALGELPVLVLLIVTAAQWARADERAATHADRTGDAELAAYNAMLKQLSERG